MGAVIHTLNPRLSADELSYIAADAEDRVIVVDESLLHVLDSMDWDFEHVIVVSDSDSSPTGSTQYESLIASSEPMSMAGDRRATRRRDVLHVGHDGSSEGGDLLTSGVRPALARAAPAGHLRD